METCPPCHVRAKANRYNYLVAFFVALGSFTYGFNSAIIGSVIGLPSFYSYFNFVETSSYGSSIVGATNGVYTAGGVIGCWTVNWLSDRLGRRMAIQIIAAICIVSAALQTGSVAISMFLVGRFLNGVGVGMINCTVPTYISEIAPAAQRGLIVGAHGICICSSYGVAGWAGLGTYFEKDPQIQWRLLVALQICAPLLLLIGSPWIPESPRWLISNDRDQEGLSILEKLHANKDDPSHIGAREEFIQIHRQLALERTKPTGNLIQLFRVPSYRKRLLMGFCLQAMCQTSGVLVISNYLVVELASLGVSGWVPLLCYGIYNSWAACLNVVNALVVDRIGRIKIIAIGIGGGIVCITIVCALVANYGYADNTNKSGALAAIVFMYFFVTCYGFGVDATSYIYCSEIFPTQIRAQGVGFSVSGLFLMNTIYLTSAGPAFKNIGWKFYLLFIVVPAVALPFFVYFYPETKGLSLEEVGALFGDEVAMDISHLSEAERATLDEKITQTMDITHFEEKGTAFHADDKAVFNGSDQEDSSG